MQILALELTNAKSYQHASVTFAEGVNAIVGHNGAGKSTILEAIGFALFDTLDYKQDEFVQEGADSAEIVVTFASSLDERSYQVVRRCGASTQYRIFDPELHVKICEGKADVLRFLRQHMGVDPTFDLSALFHDAVGVPQGTFTAVFLEPAAKRKTTFDRLLRVEEYSRAAERLREPVRLLRERRQKLEVQFSALAAHVERLPKLTTLVAERETLIQNTVAQLVAAEQQVSLLEVRRTALDVLQQQLTSLRSHHSQSTHLLQSIEAQVRSGAAALRQAEQAWSAVQANLAGYERYVAAQGQQKQLDQGLRQRQQLEKRRSELDKLLALHQNELTTVERDLSEVALAEQSLAALAPALQQQEALESALKEAQLCVSRLEDAKTQSGKLEREWRRWQSRTSELGQQLAQAATLEQHAQTLDQQIASLRTAVDVQKELLATCKNNADVLKKQNSALADITTALCPVCGQLLSSDHRDTLMAANEEKLLHLRADYKRENDQLKRIQNTLEENEKAQQGLQQQLRRLPRQAELNEAQENQTITQRDLDATRRLVEQLVNAPADTDRLTAQLAALGNPRQQHAVAQATSKRRATLEKKRNESVAQISAGQSEWSVCEQELAHFAELDAELATVTATLSDHEAAYQAVLTNRQLADTRGARLSEVEQGQQAQAKAVQAVTQAQSELTQVEAQFDAQEHQRVVAEAQSLRGQVGGLQARLTLLRQEQVRDEQEITTLRGQEHELALLQSQKQRHLVQEQALDAMRDVLKQAGPQVTKALIQQVSSSADQIFCDIMQDYTRRLRWNEDYGITLEAGGYERQFAQLSGGEQMSAALSVRLALLREMSNIDLAFFDEPTTNLDETRRDLLARQILEVKGFRQLFVISHDDTFEQATQNLIRIQRVDGVSTIEQAY
jgi:exonuclease SbcC